MSDSTDRSFIFSLCLYGHEAKLEQVPAPSLLLFTSLAAQASPALPPSSLRFLSGSRWIVLFVSTSLTVNPLLPPEC